jgi:type I restriction enzyme, R subunit
MDSYRVEVQDSYHLALADEDGEIGPVPSRAAAGCPSRKWTAIQHSCAFNDQFGNIEWKDADKIRKVISEEIPGQRSPPMKPIRTP